MNLACSVSNNARNVITSQLSKKRTEIQHYILPASQETGSGSRSRCIRASIATNGSTVCEWNIYITSGTQLNIRQRKTTKHFNNQDDCRQVSCSMNKEAHSRAEILKAMFVPRVKERRGPDVSGEIKSMLKNSQIRISSAATTAILQQNQCSFASSAAFTGSCTRLKICPT